MTFRPGGTELTQRMLELAGFPAGARLLDVCCGDGATVKLLLSRGLDAAGIDLNPKAEKSDNLPLAQGTAYDLPCETASLDGVLCECGLSLLEQDTAMAEFSRVLKRGGLLLISDVYSRADGEFHANAGSLCVHTRAGFTSLSAKHGFDILSFEDHSQALKSFLAQRIMDSGLCDICGERPLNLESVKHIKCGYFISVSKKDKSSVYQCIAPCN